MASRMLPERCEMIPKISVIVPSIRTANLENLYNSICKATTQTFEMVVVSPYELPEVLKDKENVRLILSRHSPIAAQQIGLMESHGELITWAADDGEYLPNSLDNAYNLLKDEPYTTIVTSKYLEGNNPLGMDDEKYYILSNHASMQIQYVPKQCYMLNCGLVYKSLLTVLGGWDAGIFHVCPMAYTDLAIRAYRFNCKFILQKDVMFKCSHEPGMMGTHGPIHIAQTQYDEPMFRGIYSHPSATARIFININNWRNSSEKWSIRFKDDK